MALAIIRQEEAPEADERGERHNDFVPPALLADAFLVLHDCLLDWSEGVSRL
jgi:hypothetical protein